MVLDFFFLVWLALVNARFTALLAILVTAAHLCASNVPHTPAALTLCIELYLLAVSMRERGNETLRSQRQQATAILALLALLACGVDAPVRCVAVPPLAANSYLHSGSLAPQNAILFFNKIKEECGTHICFQLLPAFRFACTSENAFFFIIIILG